MKFKLSCLIAILLLSVQAFSQLPIIPNGATWKYNDKGVDLGTLWRELAYDDVSWSSGAAVFGYGEPVTTTLSYGAISTSKYPSYYFRRSFEITDASVYTTLVFSIRRDDGAVIYLNGVEQFRTNMPVGSVSYNTLASSALGGADETTYYSFRIPATQLRNGTNVLAVSVHQSDRTSSDLSFDMEVSGETTANQSPTVSLTAPAGGTTFTAPATINLTATASDADGSVSKVEFYNGTTKLGEDLSAPYQYSWSGVSAGSYSLSAKAIDNLGMVGSSASVSVTVSSIAPPPVNGVFIPNGATWKYNDKGVDLGTLWRELAYDDVSWSSGAAVFGYGEPVTTTLSYGAISTSKYPSYYFRRSFEITDASVYTTLVFSIRRDDGAVVYLNGVEQFRTNMPVGSVSYNTLASSALGGADETTYYSFRVPATQLRNGTNVLAVSVHQSDRTSSDLSFDMEVSGETTANQSPTVSLTAPAGGTTFTAPATINLTATASDADGSVSKVEFYNGTTKLGEDLSAPYQYSWSGVSAGSYSLSAKAIDNLGMVGSSASVSVTVSSTFPPPVNGVFIPNGATWKYNDKGLDLGTLWRELAYDDVPWSSGAAVFGYGEPVTTTLSYGAISTSKYPSYYFRRSFEITDASVYTTLVFSIRRDDGAVVYLNGVEQFRTNMPVGSVSYNTLASSALGGADETTYYSFRVPATQLRNGTNVLAVSVHQSDRTSSDLSFDMEVSGETTANQSPTVTRGPYLNLATQSGIIIRWKTNIPTNSKVNFGTNQGSLAQSVTDNTLTTDHIIQLTGLNINSKYYYSVGTTDTVLQGDANNYFKTAPTVGSTEKVRILAMGDMGNNSSNQINVRNAYLNYNGNAHTDVWMLLGDNAYTKGLDNEYQTNFFDVYKESLTKNHVLWPSPGNHDYADNSARQADHAIPYYDVFSLPKNGEAGGVASGTEAYYSHNYGNIHFISLDSYGWEAGSTRLYDTTGPQATWLKQDLAANTQKWTVVYFHHPPYTQGSHNSDTETELVKIRENIVRILERYKVDLVLNGHSHSYERSYLINGHYGLEGTFDPSLHSLSSSSARYDGSNNSCPYVKKSTEARNGIVYAIVGVSGQLGGSSAGFPHNAMHYSDVTHPGSMVIDIENNRLDARFVCSDGVIRDNFTIMKDVNKTIDTVIAAGSAITLSASWVGNYIWSSGETTRSITVNPLSNGTYSVRDNLTCLTDVFNVSTVTSLKATATAGSIVCPGGTTMVTVTASGGTAPYTGTGNFNVTAGTYNYTVTDATGNQATTSITVTQPVSSLISVSGPNAICLGAHFALNASVPGGTWISYNQGVAFIDPVNGMGMGISPGFTTISYTINGCTTLHQFIVFSPENPGTLIGTSPLCAGQTTTFTTTGTTGGSWSSSNILVATVNPSSGLLTALSAGTTDITYTLTGCNGPVSSSKTLTVTQSAIAGTLIGTSPLCAGQTTTFTTTGTTGGSWSSSNTLVATVNPSSGLVTALAAGTTDITYTLTGCNGPVSSSKTLTVNTCPAPLVSCPTNIQESLVSDCAKSISIPNPQVDNTSILIWVMTGASTGSSPSSGINYIGTRVFNTGTTTITYTAKNVAGVIATCQFTVSVTDNIAPTISCPANISQSANGNNCNKNISVPNPSIGDNCGVTTLTWTMSGATSGSSLTNGINMVSTKSFNVGTTTIVYTIKDAANNVSSCSFNVTVANRKCPTSSASRSITTPDPFVGPSQDTIINNITINVLPNPTTSHFNVKLESSNITQPITLNVVDVSGKIIEIRKNLVAGQTLQLGATYRPGMYFVEMLQGDSRRIVKLVKQPD